MDALNVSLVITNLNAYHAMGLIEQSIHIFYALAYQECTSKIKYVTHAQIIV